MKYKSAKDAAEHNLYSKYRGQATGLSVSEYIKIATEKCHVCGCKPTEKIIVCRRDGNYKLRFNFVVDGKAACNTCRKLAKHFDVDYIVRHCARIMAKRMHDKRRK